MLQLFLIVPITLGLFIIYENKFIIFYKSCQLEFNFKLSPNH
jgi:hypothetical protein